MTEQFSDKTVLADVDFFPFPEMAMEGTEAVEAPIDGFMLSKKGWRQRSRQGPARLRRHGRRADAYAAVDSSNIATAKAPTQRVHPDQKKTAELMVNAKNIASSSTETPFRPWRTT